MLYYWPGFEHDCELPLDNSLIQIANCTCRRKHDCAVSFLLFLDNVELHFAGVDSESIKVPYSPHRQDKS